MAELPEISKLSGQMRDTLVGKKIGNISLLQEKCSNVTEKEFKKRVIGSKITNVYYKGKWIITALDNGENILLSLGMGADTIYFTDDNVEVEKYQIKVLFSDKSGYTIRFWWFGKFLLVSDNELLADTNTKDIALEPFNEAFTEEYFLSILEGKRTGVKSFLMNQKNVGGIGNMYMHDILFKAKLHPQKKISDMKEKEKRNLYNSINEVLNLSREKGTFSYESDFFGNKGGYSEKDFLVGYREGKPCPVCGKEIVLIKTGSTSSYICPKCQKL